MDTVEAIHDAATWGDTGVMTGMLDNDPGLLSSVWQNHTLLTWAAGGGQVGVMRLLLERGADINGYDRWGKTPLHVAASNGREEMVLLLLTNGADISRRSGLYWTALMDASGSGHVAVVRLLLRSMGGRGLDDSDSHGGTALYIACSLGHVNVVRVLLLAGADRTIADNHGRTPRQVARWWGRQQCVRLLEWWEREPQCAYALHKARTLHEGIATRQQASVAPVPAYLSPRVQEGSGMPSVEVREIQQDGPGAVRAEGGRQEKEEEVCAMVGYVVKDLTAELYTELLAGLHQ